MPDPRIRQALNHITQNLESANESAQEGIYAISHNYIAPCLSSIGSCLSSCAGPCLPLGRRDETLRRRKRGRSRGGPGRGRGRAELNFDFYDDWEWDYDYDYDYDYEEERRDGGGSSAGLFTWGHDELERLLAGSGSSDQPRRNRRMSYGARRKGPGLLPADDGRDPTVIPSSSVLGFLERFPWRIGKRGVRYRPSGADLQENPGGKARMEQEPLLEGSDEGSGSDGGKNDDGDENDDENGHVVGRQRSGTQSSRETSNSMSSRGDLFPSDDEEDAVPLDDEFAMALAPRFANDEEHRLIRRATSGTEDSRSSRGKGKTRRKSSHPQSPASGDMPTLEDLKREEERTRIEEEMEIERKRQAAEKLAQERGLDVAHGRNHDHDKIDESPDSTTHEHEHVQHTEMAHSPHIPPPELDPSSVPLPRDVEDENT